MSTLLCVEGLEVRYHTNEGILTALHEVDLSVAAGEIVGIVGESGCGKSTVASTLMRLLPPNGRIAAGRVLFEGRDLLQLDAEEMRQLRGKQMSMIFQDPMTSLNPVFSVETQMLDALQAHASTRDRSVLRERAVQMLTRVGIPDAARQIKAYPHQFSGGMRQRIMIAMALLSSPSLLIADEPTSALDATLEAQIVDLIRGLRDELGTAVLYITHDLGVVAQLCDRVLVMYAGNTVESGDVYDLFEAPKHPYTQALLCSHPSLGVREARLATIRGRVPSLLSPPLGCRFAPRCDHAMRICHEQMPRTVQLVRRQVACHAYGPHWEGSVPIEASQGRPARHVSAAVRRQLTDALTVIETQQLRVYYHDHIDLLGQILGQRASAVRAVDGVDLRVRRGETLAVAGESGSGKTTLARTILRLEQPTRGRILLEGQDITQLSASNLRVLRARMQMIFQDPYSSLSPRMRVSSLLLEPFRIHGVPVDEQRQVGELLEMVGLSAEQADKYPHQLSGGQARRVGIARALALRPDILVADEPTAGLDVSVAAGILNLLKDLREKLQLTYVIITHNLSVISFIADRVAIMYLGKVAELAAAEALFRQPRHPYTEALMSAISVPDPRLREKGHRILLEGEIPSPRKPPPGCLFHPRCRYAEERCSVEAPPLVSWRDDQHLVACHFPERAQLFKG